MQRRHAAIQRTGFKLRAKIVDIGDILEERRWAIGRLNLNGAVIGRCEQGQLGQLNADVTESDEREDHSETRAQAIPFADPLHFAIC